MISIEVRSSGRLGQTFRWLAHLGASRVAHLAYLMLMFGSWYKWDGVAIVIRKLA